MFIITALMTIPVGIAGIFIWPGTPARPNMLFLSNEELDHAIRRLEDNKSDVSERPKRSRIQILKSIFRSKLIYILCLWDIFFWNAGTADKGGYLLWLKSLKRYSATKLTQIGTTQPALGALYVILINFSSDLLLGRTGAITLAHTMNFIGLVILAVWQVPEGAKWFAFNLQYFSPAMSSVLYGWINDLLRHDAQERAIVLVVANMVAQSTTAWTPLLVFKTFEGPRWLKGWSFAATSAALTIIWTVVVIRPLSRKQEYVLGCFIDSSEQLTHRIEDA